MLRRTIIALLAAAAVSLAAAATSHAIVHPEAFPANGSGVSFTFRGTAAEDEVDVSLGVSPQPLTILDEDGVIGVLAGGCEPISSTEASCPAYEGRYEGRLRAGNDEVHVGGNGDGTLKGGDGLDYLNGGSGDEEISGGLDNDNLAGGEGADLIVGGQGADTLRGGINSDLLRADDGSADNDIDCGPGSHDVARIDRKIDPRPWSCERVVRVR